MRNFIISLLVMLVATNVTAQTANDKAEQAYQQKDYVQAAKSYAQLLPQKGQVSHNAKELEATYYNLGNCHYRLKNIGQAIWCYQQALRINPADDDAQFNLQLSQTKTQDNLNASTGLFFTSFFKKAVCTASSDTWGGVALIMLVLCVASALTCKMGKSISIRKASFAFSIIFGIFTLSAYAFAYIEQHFIYPGTQAVVIQEIQTYASPTVTSAKTRTLHEGAIIGVNGRTGNNWIEAELQDGMVVYLQSDITLPNANDLCTSPISPSVKLWQLY